LTTAIAQQAKTSTNKPSHIAYTVRPGKEGQKAFWCDCGVAWPHKDGKGLRIKLDAFPVNGVIELRVNEPEAANDASKIDWTDFSEFEER
jgi:hypothetical protein